MPLTYSYTWRAVCLWKSQWMLNQSEASNIYSSRQGPDLRCCRQNLSHGSLIRYRMTLFDWILIDVTPVTFVRMSHSFSFDVNDRWTRARGDPRIDQIYSEDEHFFCNLQHSQQDWQIKSIVDDVQCQKRCRLPAALPCRWSLWPLKRHVALNATYRGARKRVLTARVCRWASDKWSD